MTDLLAEIANPTVNDFRRKGCKCVWCAKDKGDPMVSHPGVGAPLVKDQRTGKMVTFRRPSSMGKPLEDTYHLDLWTKRTVLFGTATAPSIAAKAANLDQTKDKDKLNALAEAAIESAKGNQAADLGTEMHVVVERLNLGIWTIDDVPEMFRADAEAYLAALDRHGLSIVPDMVELKVVNDTVRCAGTFDMILDNYTADLKTGQKIDYGQVGIAVQIAVYKHARRYDVVTDERSDLPPTDDDIGLVVHLPYGSGRCDIVDVDIAAGWKAAQLASEARSWNYRRDLFKPHAVSTGPARPGGETADTGVEARPESPPVSATSDRLAWFSARYFELTQSGIDKSSVAAAWPDIPPPKFRDQWTPEQLEQACKVVQRLHAQAGLPFPEPLERPTRPAKLRRKPKATKTLATPADTQDLKSSFYELDEVAKTSIRQWQAEGVDAGRPWSAPTQKVSRWHWLVNAAAVGVARHADGDDEVARGWVALIIGDDDAQTHPVGALIGTLSLTEAEQLVDLTTARTFAAAIAALDGAA